MCRIYLDLNLEMEQSLYILIERSHPQQSNRHVDELKMYEQFVGCAHAQRRTTQQQHKQRKIHYQYHTTLRHVDCLERS